MMSAYVTILKSFIYSSGNQLADKNTAFNFSFYTSPPPTPETKTNQKQRGGGGTNPDLL